MTEDNRTLLERYQELKKRNEALIEALEAISQSTLHRHTLASVARFAEITLQQHGGEQ